MGVHEIDHLVREYGALLVFVAVALQAFCMPLPGTTVGRFITGLRNITGLLAGSSGMPFRRFLPVTAAATLVWALQNALEYYFFGHILLGASTWVQVVLIAAGVVWLVISLSVLRRRTLRRLRAAPVSADPT